MLEIVPLAVDQAPLGVAQWTVHAVVEQHVKWSPQTGGRPQYAELTLRAEPYNGPERTVFVNTISPNDKFAFYCMGPEDELFLQSCIEGVVEGVEEGLRRSAAESFPITNVLIGLTDLQLHRMDSNPSVCRHAAIVALRMCLKRENLVQHAVD